MAGINVFKDGNAIASSGASGFYQRVAGIWSPMGAGGSIQNVVYTTGNQTISGNKTFASSSQIIMPSGSNGKVFFGQSNNPTGNFSTIAGGYLNVSSGNYSTVVGGISNQSSAVGATIVGGADNRASSVYCFVGGGGENRTTGQYATIAGGYSNEITGDYGFIGGGWDNVVTDQWASVVGGYSNVNKARNGIIGGGESNTIEGGSYDAFLGAGQNNIMDTYSTQSFLGAGYQNYLVGQNTVLVGGEENYLSGSLSFIGGGYQHSGLSDYCFIGGGNNNVIQPDSFYAAIVGGICQIGSGGQGAFIGGGVYNGLYPVSQYSVLVGGFYNGLSGQYSFLGGGLENVLSGSGTVLVGGSGNSGLGYMSTFGGGQHGYLNGNFSVLAGGNQNILSGDSSVMGGGEWNALSGVLGVIAGGGFNYISPLSNIFGSSFVGIDTAYGSIGGGSLNAIYNCNWGTIAGGNGNGIACTGTSVQTAANTIGGGKGNSINGKGMYSTIPGGFSQTIWNSIGASVLGSNNTIYSGNYAISLGNSNISNSGSHYSLAAGRRAIISGNHSGAGVLADSQNRDHVSKGVDSLFLDYASGTYATKSITIASGTGYHFMGSDDVITKRNEIEGRMFKTFDAPFGTWFTITGGGAGSGGGSVSLSQSAWGIRHINNILSGSGAGINVFGTDGTGVNGVIGPRTRIGNQISPGSFASTDFTSKLYVSAQLVSPTNRFQWPYHSFAIAFGTHISMGNVDHSLTGLTDTTAPSTNNILFGMTCVSGQVKLCVKNGTAATAYSSVLTNISGSSSTDLGKFAFVTNGSGTVSLYRNDVLLGSMTGVQTGVIASGCHMGINFTANTGTVTAGLSEFHILNAKVNWE